jgi:hypothetical protein
MRIPPPLFDISMTEDSVAHLPKFAGSVSIKYLTEDKKFSLEEPTSTKKEMQQQLAQKVLNFISNEALKTTQAANKSKSTPVIKHGNA